MAMCLRISGVQPVPWTVISLALLGLSSSLSLPLPLLFLTCCLSRLTGLRHHLVLELAGGDLLGALDGLLADQDGGLGQRVVVVDVTHRGVRLEVVGVERQHRAEVVERLADEAIALAAARPPRPLRHDLREVDARRDRAHLRVGRDRAREVALCLPLVACLIGGEAELGDRRRVVLARQILLDACGLGRRGPHSMYTAASLWRAMSMFGF
jgi:hypothetical protein